VIVGGQLVSLEELNSGLVELKHSNLMEQFKTVDTHSSFLSRFLQSGDLLSLRGGAHEERRD